MSHISIVKTLNILSSGGEEKVVLSHSNVTFDQKILDDTQGNRDQQGILADAGFEDWEYRIYLGGEAGEVRLCFLPGEEKLGDVTMHLQFEAAPGQTEASINGHNQTLRVLNEGLGEFLEEALDTDAEVQVRASARACPHGMGLNFDKCLREPLERVGREPLPHAQVVVEPNRAVAPTPTPSVAS